MAQGVDGVLADLVLGHFGDKGNIVFVVCERHGDIGLAACIGRLKGAGLQEAQIAGRVEAHHDFAEGNDFTHASFTAFINSLARAVILSH